MAASTFSSNRLLLPACVALGLAAPASGAGFDILGCATREREAVTPNDPLDCQWKEGAFGTSLVQLYRQGWRLIDAEYFDDDHPVFYLERPASSDDPSPPEDRDTLSITPG